MLSQTLRELKSGKINEDVVVPISQLRTLTERLQALEKGREIILANFGHAGNGNLHVNILYDAQSPKQKKEAEDCMRAVFEIVLELGGSLSGEHGIGLSKREFVTMEVPPSSLRTMQAIKKLFDPRNILNPDKNLPPP